MFDTSTDHQILPFGDDKMGLYEAQSGDQIALAERKDGKWTITAKDVDDKHADSRSKAIDKLKDAALETLDGDGYSTNVPRGLRDKE